MTDANKIVCKTEQYLEAVNFVDKYLQIIYI